jgi:hypothetical protein
VTEQEIIDWLDEHPGSDVSFRRLIELLVSRVSTWSDHEAAIVDAYRHGMTRTERESALNWLKPLILGPRPEPAVEGRQHLLWCLILPGNSIFDGYLAEYLFSWSVAAGLSPEDALADFRTSLQL